MRIEAIPEMMLDAADDAAIAALLAAAFADGFGGRSYHQQRHHLRVVARDGAMIVGHVALLFRTIRLGDRLTPIVGVAEVATDRAHRGQGIAAALLAEAIDRSRASLAEFMVLFGDRPLYAAAGFVPCANTLTYVPFADVTSHAVRTEVIDGLMILPLRDAVWDADAPVDLVGHVF